MADGALPANIPPVLKHYRLERQLGAGGMGMVFEASDRRDESRVAIKLLYPHLAADASFRERFEREAHYAALLRSPYTVHILDYGLAEGYYFIVMEYVEGRSLGDLIRSGPVEPAQALHIAADAARALEEAGARGVVHRDIKPDNILIANDGVVKVADFGIARQSGSGELTIPGGFVGTALFAAPEQSSGEGDGRADIYALGCTLYMTLTGRPPYTGSAAEVLRAHAEAPFPAGPLAGLPDPVVNLVRRCMEKDPADRYRDATELSAALERATRAYVNLSTRRPTAAPTATPVMPPAPIAATEVAPPPPAQARPVTPAEAVATPVPLAAPIADPGDVAPLEVPPAPESAGATAVMPPYTPPPQTGVDSWPAVAPATPTPRAAEELPSGEAGPLRLELAPVGADGSRRLTLTVHNDGTAAALVPLAGEGDEDVGVSLPKSVAVPAGSSVNVPVSVRPRKSRRSGEKIRRTFGITAGGGDGGIPPVTVAGGFDDIPNAFPIIAGAVLAGAVVLVAAIFGVMAVLGGGGGGDDDDEPLPTRRPRTPTPAVLVASPTPAPRATPSPSPSPSPSLVASPSPSPAVSRTPSPSSSATATARPPTAAATSTPTQRPPSPTTLIGLGIAAGRWDYSFTVTSNTCGFGLEGGEVFETAFDFIEVNAPDQFIAVGERITVTESNTGFFVGNFTFSYPVFGFSYPVVAQGRSGTATLSNFFNGRDTGTATLRETYGTCAIDASE